MCDLRKKKNAMTTPTNPEGAIVPGMMHCAKCKFVLTRKTLHINYGMTSAGDNKTEPCPNGCGPLWPYTWKMMAESYGETLEKQFDEIKELKAQLATANPTPSKGLLRGHRMIDKKSNEQRYYDTLKEITNYMAPNKIRKDAHNLGLSEEEYLEMAYDNIRATAIAAIHNKRRPQA